MSITSRTALRRLDGLVHELAPELESSRVPGAALAVVAGGRIAYTAGLGCRDAKTKAPVTADTVYPVASTTKAINATLLGILVDQGKLQWDAPVQRYLPRFRLSDPLTSMRLTVRDLVTMRSGLPRHDLIWFANPTPRAELLDRLPHLELSDDFRNRFQYNNLTYVVAGHIAEVVTGKKWEDLVRKHIFAPLGMRSSGFANPATGDVTKSYHETAEGDLVRTRRFSTGESGPCGGSIHSTVKDLARWALFNLNGGLAGRRRLIAAETLAEIHAPQMVCGNAPEKPTPNAVYGLGWFIDAYRGMPRIEHGGYLHDVDSLVTLLPEEKLGIVSFTNFGAAGCARLINEHVIDLLFGQATTERFESRREEYARLRQENQSRIASLSRQDQAPASHALVKYSGRYVHAGYGEVVVRRRKGELLFQLNQLTLPLRHWHYDTWAFVEAGIFPIHRPHSLDPSRRIQFRTDEDGAMVGLSVALEPNAAPIEFRKVSKRAPGARP